LDDPVLAREELIKFKDLGGKTLVDQTPRGVNRNINSLKKLSDRTGINIITGTGWFKEAYYDLDFAKTKVDQLSSIMIADLTEGIDDSGIKAGIIGEINVNARWVTPSEERMHRAAARAQAKTGRTVAIAGTHISTAMDQLDILEDEGADLRKVIVNHINGNLDDDFYSHVALRGTFICLNTFPVTSNDLMLRHVSMCMKMVKEGLIDQILISNGVSIKQHLTAYGGGGYVYAISSLRDQLIKRGMSLDDWNQIMQLNPERCFTIE
jgi:phosphotriesterase-related protein